MKAIFYGAGAAAFAVLLAAASGSSAQATPAVNSRMVSETVSASDGLVLKAVTRAGFAHRSARRTARRTSRRHGY